MGRKRRLKGSLAISLKAVDKDPPNFDSWVFKRADAYMNSFTNAKKPLFRLSAMYVDLY